MSVTPTVWVANTGAGTVSKIDPVANTVLATVTVAASPWAICFGAGSVWVACNGSVKRIDPLTATVIATITIGASSSGIDFDGTYIWASSETAGNVSKIDPASNTVVATVTTGTTAAGVIYAIGSIWVCNFGASTVSRINPSTNTVIATVSASIASPAGISSDGIYVWVANYGASTVAKINPATNLVALQVSVGTQPYGVGFDGTYIWVSDSGSANVKKIDPVANTVIATVTVGTTPYSITMGFDGSNMWVPNYGGGTVSKINVTSNTVTATVTVGANPGGAGCSFFIPTFLPPKVRRNDVQSISPNVLHGKVRRWKGYPQPFFSFTEVYTQGFRIENTSLFEYKLYVGENAPVDFTAPVATSPTLPFSWTPSLPSSGNATYNVTVRQRNRFNMESFNEFSTVLKFVSHVMVKPPVSIPQNVIVYDDVSGYIRVVGKYVSTFDLYPADTWELYVKFGSDPVPGVDIPVYTGLMTFLGVEAGFLQVEGAYTLGTIAHVILAAVRSSDGNRGAAPVILHEIALSLNLSEGFMFGGNTFEEE